VTGRVPDACGTGVNTMSSLVMPVVGAALKSGLGALSTVTGFFTVTERVAVLTVSATLWTPDLVKVNMAVGPILMSLVVAGSPSKSH